MNTSTSATKTQRGTAKAVAKKAASKRAPAKKTSKAAVDLSKRKKKPAAGARKPAAKKGLGAKKGLSAKKGAAAKKPIAKTVSAAPASKPKAAAKKDGGFTGETGRLRKLVIDALEDLKAKDVKEIDVRGRASFADLLVIASGTSTRHVKSLADEVVKFVKKAGMMPLGVEGEREAEWVLVDLGDIVVHVMLPRIREFYGLERLWSVGSDSAEGADDLV